MITDLEASELGASGALFRHAPFPIRWVSHKQYCQDMAAYERVCRRREILRRWIHRTRMKRPAVNSTDLCMAPFDRPRDTVSVLDRGKRYIFRVAELFKIIDVALTHAIDLFSSPTRIKNPYTGLPFTDATLYLVYLKIVESPFCMPPLFSFYTDTGFRKRAFLHRHEPLLRDIILRRHVESLTPYELKHGVKTMIAAATDLNKNPLFSNVNWYPHKTLKKFLPWLLRYYTHLYSLNVAQRVNGLNDLILKMVDFKRDHPDFGEFNGDKLNLDIKAPIAGY